MEGDVGVVEEGKSENIVNIRRTMGAGVAEHLTRHEHGRRPVNNTALCPSSPGNCEKL